MQKLVIASLLLVASAVSFVGAMEEGSLVKIKQSSLMAPASLGSIEVFHDQDGFHVMKDDERHDVKNYFVDPLLRKANKKTLKKFQKVGYLSVKQMSDGEFSLTANTRLLGGGVGGATAGFWIGRFVTQTIGYGIVAIVALPALAGGPFVYSGVVMGLAGTCAPLIESASNVVAIGTAVIGGTITGPV